MIATTSVDRRAHTATIRVEGDVVIPTAKRFYDQLRSAVRLRDAQRIVIDLEHAERVDSSALAAVSLARQLAARSGKQVELAHLDARHAAAFELLPTATTVKDAAATHGVFERAGLRVLALAAALRELGALFADTFRQLAAVIARRKRLPVGATSQHIAIMGNDALPIVGLLALLLGATLAFQGIVLMQRFGAGVYVADMIGLGMVREFAPLMTAIILVGRTGAAIAAELGTMRVRGELDALAAMGVSSTRFLLLPRLLALTFVQPALTLIAMFVGMAGGMLVIAAQLHVPPWLFWDRVVDRVELHDFIHGIAKSFVFAWIIGFTGSFLGNRAKADPSAVGTATTRTVVVGVFLIILVDAVAATLVAVNK
jgi:phospholipid/cholesterol/gamma-HCH transport system permease protein